MRINTVTLSLILAILGGFILGMFAAADSDKLNPAVRSTLARLYDDRELVDIDEREKRDELIYVIRLREGNQRRNVILEIAKDGKLLEIDEDMPLAQIPRHIKKAVHNVFPHGKIRHGEMETEMSVTYRLDLENAGKHLRVKLSRSGKIHEIEKRR